MQEQSRQAGEIIGFNDMFFEDMPDNMMDTIPLLDIIQTVEQYIGNINPDIIFTHAMDLNLDHCIVHRAVITAVRPGYSKAREIYAFETPSSTEWNYPNTFNSNVFIDIKDTLEDKLRALTCYRTEIREFPHPRSIEGLRILAKYRGMQSGFEVAEAFELVRCVK